MSEKSKNPVPETTAPEPAPAPKQEEPKNPEPQFGLFTKIWMRVNSPVREMFHPVKYHLEEAAVHTAEAVKLAKVNPNDRPTVGSFLRGAGKLIVRGAVIGLSVLGASSLIHNDSTNTEEPTCLESNNSDIIE